MVIRSRWRLALALLLCAVAVRPLAVGIGPLLPDIQRELGASPLMAGLIGTLPVLCLGLFAPLGAPLARRSRPETALAFALAITVVFGAARAAAPGVGTLLLLTLGLGIGMGLAGALPSMIIKDRAADQPARMTGMHGIGVVSGSVIGAALVAPLALVGGGWREGVLLITVPIAISTIAGLWLLGRGASRSATSPRTRLAWRDANSWLFAGIFGLQSLIYWSLVIWLAAILVTLGWTTTAAALAVVAYQTASLVGVVLVGAFADAWGTRREQLLLASSAVTCSMIGFIVLPGLAVGWIALAGLSLGSALPLALTLPVDHARDEQETGSMAGLMLLVGYVVAATGPPVVGIIREITVEALPIFVALSVFGLTFIVLSARLVAPVPSPVVSPEEGGASGG